MPRPGFRISRIILRHQYPRYVRAGCRWRYLLPGRRSQTIASLC
jgi:hypothetical protein